MEMLLKKEIGAAPVFSHDLSLVTHDSSLSLVLFHHIDESIKKVGGIVRTR